MADAGEDVRAYKPLLTGTDEPADGGWPRDDELLAAACGRPSAEVTTYRFGPPASPHLAAELAGVEIDRGRLLADAKRLAAPSRTLVVEGVGGLLVPIAREYTVCDLASELGLPLVIAARPGLGTINHTLLTLRAARAAGLDVRAVVLTPWPARPGAIERSNRDTIADLGAVAVERLGPIEAPAPAVLASAGRLLPWERWLARR